MGSIERRFQKISQENPFWSSFTVFEETVRGQGFSYYTIRKSFDKLVDKNDYDEHYKKALLSGIYGLAEKQKGNTLYTA